MKNIFLFLFSFLFLTALFAQNKVKTYNANYSQALLFSGSQVTDGGKSVPSIMRFSFLGNYGRNFHADFTKNFGLFTGLEGKNLGFITQEDTSKINKPVLKIKRRIYGMSIPLALKVGNLEKWYLYGGAEYMYAFNYKMKMFNSSGDKTKYESKWGGTETRTFIPSVFFGINWKSIDIKAQYYFQNFMSTKKAPLNKGFSQNPDYYTNYNASIVSIQLGLRGDYIKKWLEGLSKGTPPPPMEEPKKKSNGNNVKP